MVCCFRGYLLPPFGKTNLSAVVKSNVRSFVMCQIRVMRMTELFWAFYREDCVSTSCIKELHTNHCTWRWKSAGESTCRGAMVRKTKPLVFRRKLLEPVIVVKNSAYLRESVNVSTTIFLKSWTLTNLLWQVHNIDMCSVRARLDEDKVIRCSKQRPAVVRELVVFVMVLCR